MEKRVLLDLTYHKVYYIKTSVVNFYLTVPKTVVSTNISIELKNKMGNYNLELNDEVWVMDNIKNLFSYIDNYNISLALPVLDENEINALEKMDSTKFENIDKILGEVINTAYKILLEEKKQVSKQIVLINNERYKTFITWFVTRYKDRVICKNLLELIQIFNVNATSYKKLETPVMNFVVGSYGTEVDAPKVVKEDIPQETALMKPQLQPSSGFASYWILVIITIVVAAVVAIIAFTS